MSDDDVLVGLRFEVSGGLGRMAGRVVGKAGPLYLVQKQGAEHLELLELDDLRSAKFYRETPVDLPVDVPVDMKAPVTAITKAAAPVQSEPEAPQGSKRRLSDQIRKHLGGA